MRKRIVDVAYAFFFQHLWLLTGLCLVVTLVGVLWACAHNGHLPAEFPSPSDTGSFQPESAFFTFGLFWAMIGLAATFGRHALVFGTFLADQRKQHRATHFSTSTSTSGKPGWLGVVTALLLSERDDLKLLKMGTIIGIAGACFGTMVAAFDVRKHVVLHTIGAACLFIFTNLYYSILLRINHLVLERHALIHDATRLREDDVRLSQTGNMNNRSLTDSTIISLSSSPTSPPPISLVSSSVVDTTTTLSSSSSSTPTTSSSTPSSSREAKHHGGHLGFKAVVGRNQGVSNLTWLRVLSVMGCWFCLFGIIGFRLQFVSEGGHQSWDKQRVAFLIFWANLFEWLWLGLVLIYGFIVFYWDYYHSPLSSPYFGFSPSSSGAAAPLVFRIRCEVQRPDDVHLV